MERIEGSWKERESYAVLPTERFAPSFDLVRQWPEEEQFNRQQGRKMTGHLTISDEMSMIVLRPRSRPSVIAHEVVHAVLGVAGFNPGHTYWGAEEATDSPPVESLLVNPDKLSMLLEEAGSVSNLVDVMSLVREEGGLEATPDEIMDELLLRIELRNRLLQTF